MNLLEAISDYNAGDILWLGDWSPAWIMALLLLGVGVVALSAYDLRTIRPGRRWALVGLRALVYLLAVAMLLEPALDLKNISRVKNHVPVLVDQSRSMELKVADGDQTRYERVAEALPELAGLIERTRGEHEFHFFAVGEELEPSSRPALQEASPQQGASDLSQALRRVTEQFEGEDLGGVLLISDGIDTGAIGRRTQRGEELDEASRQLLEGVGAPVNTAAAARAEGIKDVAITRVLRDDFAFVHNKVSVEVELQVIGLEATTFPVTLRRDGQLVQTRQLTVTPEQTDYRVTFEFVPERIGEEIYAVGAPEFEGEALAANNRSYFLLKIIRDKIRALQVVGQPSWDERFLRRLLKRNPNVDLISFFILRTNQSVNNVPTNELSLIPFPTRELFEEQLGSFDMIIFQNFNFGPYNMRQYLPEIAEFVKKGGGFVMVGGDLSFASGGYARTPIEEILPVMLPPGGGEAVIDTQDFKPELTEAGQRHPITQLAFDPKRNRELWQELPSQQGTNIVLEARDGATVLARHPRLRHGGEQMPVITVSEVGRGRAMALTTDSSWRWGFEHLGAGGTAREYQLFWNNAIRWLIKDPELKLVKIELAEDEHIPGASVGLTVRVSKPDYSPAANVEGVVEISRRGLEGLSQDEQLEQEDLEPIEFVTTAAGVANLELVPEEPGAYDLRARVETEAGSFEDRRTLLVVPDVSEYRDIIPRDDLLEAMAQATGGAALGLPGGSLDELELREPRAVKINRRRVIQLWDTAATFLILLSLLGVEWTLRRRWGRL